MDSGQVEIGLIDPYYGYRLHTRLRAGAAHSAPQYFAAGVPLACGPRSGWHERRDAGQLSGAAGEVTEPDPAGAEHLEGGV